MALKVRRLTPPGVGGDEHELARFLAAKYEAEGDAKRASEASGVERQTVGMQRVEITPELLARLNDAVKPGNLKPAGKR